MNKEIFEDYCKEHSAAIAEIKDAACKLHESVTQWYDDTIYRKPLRNFMGWKVRIEYQATGADNKPYRSERWFFLDREATCVVKSFEIPLT